MSMWSPQPPPHPQSLGPRAVGRCCCCCCFPACQGLASPLPAPPFPQLGLWGQLQGLGESQIAKTPVTSSPICEAGSPHASPCLSSVPAGNTQTQRPRPPPEPLADKASGRALLGPPGPASLEWPAWPVSIYCLHVCRPLGPLACHLCPQARCHLPRQALPRPSQDNCGTKRAQPPEPTPVPPLLAPPWSGPGLDRTGTCPCFSFSDQEINFPEGAGGVCCLSLGEEGWANSSVALRGQV